MKDYGKAIVVGSGISGLVTARVLARYFEEVLLIDRDQIPDDGSIRKAVPQGHHVHTLLPGGLEVLISLFPQLEADLDNLGGRTAGPDEWYALTPAGKTYRISRFQATPIADGLNMRIQSRGLLEHCIRKGVEALPNVAVRYATTVSQPIAHEATVSGVWLASGERIDANLVLDASGRVSRTLGWLDKLDYQRPLESTINCDFAYTSIFFEPPPQPTFTDAGFLISSAREGQFTKRAGSLVRVENNRWQVTLAGRLGDYPPATLEGFLSYTRTLHNPQITSLLEHATPLTEPHQYKFPKSVRRHYEKLERFPQGLLPVGDALCHFNPGYGQGMSVACRQVAELDRLLAERKTRNRGLQGLWAEYFDAVHQQTRAPWLFAAMNDFKKKGTTGDFPAEENDVLEKLKQLNLLADQGDTEAATLVDAIFDMRLPLSALESV